MGGACTGMAGNNEMEEMPKRDLQSEMNDADLAGIPFRWDSAGICFSLVCGLSTFQPLPL